MDKETLSKYGWVVIVIIVLVILMSFAAPFGQYFSDSTMKMVKSLKSATNIEQLFIPNGGENGGTQEVVTNYTSVQIEADEHLYAIGKTQPEYVVAEFNDDYTEVVITKNGDESDGLMMGWMEIDWESGMPISMSESPMVQHITTLLNADIRNGVKNIGAAAFLASDLDTGEDVVSALEKIEFSNSIEEIGVSAFYNSTNLKNLYYNGTADEWVNILILGPESSPIEYTENLYFNNSLVTSVSFNSNINEIGTCSFYGYEKLTSVEIPDSVTTVGKYAFANCNISDLTMPDNMNIWYNSFLGNPVVETFYNSSYQGTYVQNYILRVGRYQSAQYAGIKEGTTNIANGAVSETDTWLYSLYLPDGIINIAPNAIHPNANVSTVFGTPGSYAETWAVENGYTFREKT